MTINLLVYFNISSLGLPKESAQKNGEDAYCQ